MIRTYRQFALWHPERGMTMMPWFTTDAPITTETIWERFPESVSMEPKQVQQWYESQGWTVVSVIVSVQVED